MGMKSLFKTCMDIARCIDVKSKYMYMRYVPFVKSFILVMNK